jgi:hypothetical protein
VTWHLALPDFDLSAAAVTDAIFASSQFHFPVAYRVKKTFDFSAMGPKTELHRMARDP